MSKVEGRVIPIGHSILCERVLPPDKMHGIFIPDNKVRERLMKWRVLAVGDKAERFKKDDIVLASWFLGIPVDVLDEDIDHANYRIFTDTEPVGIWKN